MHNLRSLILRNAWLAGLLLAFVLCVRALVPAGLMVSPSDQTVLTVSICADATGGEKTFRMAIPAQDDQGAPHAGDAAGDGPCAFSGLWQPALGGADASLLAAAFAFILLLGLAPLRRIVAARAVHLRPPLRGPPAIA